jgi:hypothetical protein
MEIKSGRKKEPPNERAIKRESEGSIWKGRERKKREKEQEREID